MSELIINATPSLPPSGAGTGNVNALNQGEAAGRSIEGAKTSAESGTESPFAAALRSRTDQKTSQADAADDATSPAAATQTNSGDAAISVDLSLLLPFLAANPSGTAGLAPAPASVAETNPDQRLLPGVHAIAAAVPAQVLASVPAAPGVTSLPTTPAQALPAAPAQAVPATPAAARVAPLADPAEPLPAISAAQRPLAPAPVADSTLRQQHGEAADQAYESAGNAKYLATSQAPGKMALDAAIAADARSRTGGSGALEAPANEFHALMQHAALVIPVPASPTNSAASSQNLSINTPLGQPGWQEEIGQKLTWMVGNGRQQADLVLTPPNLGRVEVSLTMNGDQATAVFASSSQAVRETLENSLHRLREVLADAGVSLGQAQVGSESPNRSSREQEAGGKQGLGVNDGVRYASNASLPRPTAVAERGFGRGIIDTFA